MCSWKCSGVFGTTFEFNRMCKSIVLLRGDKMSSGEGGPHQYIRSLTAGGACPHNSILNIMKRERGR